VLHDALQLKNPIHNDTWRAVNRRLAEYAVQSELICGDKLRLDTMALDTNRGGRGKAGRCLAGKRKKARAHPGLSQGLRRKTTLILW